MLGYVSLLSQPTQKWSVGLPLPAPHQQYRPLMTWASRQVAAGKHDQSVQRKRAAPWQVAYEPTRYVLTFVVSHCMDYEPHFSGTGCHICLFSHILFTSTSRCQRNPVKCNNSHPLVATKSVLHATCCPLFAMAIGHCVPSIVIE